MERFFPQAFGWAPKTEEERRFCGLRDPFGLGIPVPQELAAELMASSEDDGEDLIQAILGQDFNYVQDLKAIHRRRNERREANHLKALADAKELLPQLQGRAHRTLLEHIQGAEDSGSSWLSRAPIEQLGLLLTRQTFRDAIALRAGHDLPDPLPQICPSCGANNSVIHALDCKHGRQVRARHEEVKKAWVRLFEKAGCTFVQEEPYCEFTSNIMVLLMVLLCVLWYVLWSLWYYYGTIHPHAPRRLFRE